MIEKILSALLIVPLFFSSRAVSSNVALQEGHSHSFSDGVCACGACDGSHPGEWTAWSTTDSLPATTGKYYLTTDVTLKEAWTISGKDIALCLNDHIVNLGPKKTFALTSSGKLTIYDCGTTVRYYDENSTNGVWRLKGSGTSEHTTTGGIIIGGTAVNGGAINVASGCNLTLNGGNIVGNTSNTFTSEDSASGGGVYTNGTFVMNGGNIVGNTCFLGPGGGVSMSGGTFVMNGGCISNNRTGRNGGGLYASARTFTLKGGEISENSSVQNGAGVYADVGHTFNMNGGKISNNNATLNGAGVYTNGTFTMSGGEISGNNTTRNKAGGVYGNGTVLLGGAAKVINNSLGTDAHINNYYVCGGKFITIGTKTASDDGNGVAAPTSEFKVGINMDKAGKFTSNGTEDDVKCFTSDSEDYQVKYNADGYLELAVSPIPSPVMNPTGGYATSVTITAEKGTIYYTTNGANPTASSTRYTGPIAVTSDNFVIKAIAFAEGKKSEVVTGTFTNVKKSTYTVNINAVNGTVDVNELTDIAAGTAFSVDDNKLTVGDTIITATANEGYDFNCWKINDAEPVTGGGIIIGNTKFTAVFSDHDLVKVDGTPATEDHDGFKDAYKCNNCGQYFEDAEGTILIGDEAAYNAWKLAGGRIPALNPHGGEGLSGGAIAGIIIGSLLGLLIIVFVVLYILWKKKNLNVPFLSKVLTPAFRFINKLFFKTKLNEVEAKDAEARGMEEEDYLKALKDESLMKPKK